jgi:hypothetical protein
VSEFPGGIGEQVTLGEVVVPEFRKIALPGDLQIMAQSWHSPLRRQLLPVMRANIGGRVRFELYVPTKMPAVVTEGHRSAVESRLAQLLSFI